jgi:uncharacterized protein
VPDSKGTIVIAGGSGFIGQICRRLFSEAGYSVIVLTRKQPVEVSEVYWDAKSLGDWVSKLDGAIAVVNLCGKTIATKFTESTKAEILTSRTATTKLIGDAIEICEVKPLWLNASAIGFYGDRGDEVLSETSSSGQGFLGETCLAWEDAILKHNVDCPKAVVRIGVVLGAGEGALKPLVTLTKLFLGGAAGNGKQSFSWIHAVDLVRMMVWIVNERKVGIYNGTAPSPVTNAEFMACLRGVLHRPWSPPAPAIVLQVIGNLFGPDASLLLSSQRVLPTRALSEGFQFEYSELEPALKSLLL